MGNAENSARRPRGIGFRAAFLACAIACVPVALGSCSRGQSAQTAGRKPSAVPVLAALAVQKDVPLQLHAIGTVEAFSTVIVKTMVNGQLVKVLFREGQDVRKGERIFVIDPRPYEAALKVAEGVLKKDIALMTNAEKDLERYRTLIEKDLIPKQQFDQIASNAAALSATVQADNAAVENARVQLSYCYIRSPIDGRTGSLFVQEGNVVKANDTSLVSINQVTPIRVSFAVPERNLAEIRKSMAKRPPKVEASVPGQEGDPALGALTFIGNAVDNTTGTIPLKALFSNADRRLWPGQFVNVAITLTNLAGAVLVPTPAVQTGQEGSYVFVIGPDLTVESRPVVTGETVGGETVIERGIRAGERVVTDGQLRLVPGARVEVKTGLEG